MPLVPAKCPECGGTINIDSAKKAVICEYCKQPFIVEEAINNFNTTYNITNNNEIKADVINILNGNNIEQELQTFKDKISLMLKLKESNGLFVELKKLYDYKEKHKENVLVHEVFINILIDVYEAVLEGLSIRNFLKGPGAPYVEPKHPLKELLEEGRVISLISNQKGEKAYQIITKFYDELYRSITTPVDRDNDINKVKGYYERVHSTNGISVRGINFKILSWDFIINKYYPHSYDKTFKEKIEPILDVCTKHYIGFEKVFGRFAIVPSYWIDDGYDCNGTVIKILDVSITTLDQINTLVQKNINKIHPQKIHQWEEERRYLSWKLNDYKQCYGCGKKLSIMGKCKTPGCRYYNKSIREELSVLDSKIKKAKL